MIRVLWLWTAGLVLGVAWAEEPDEPVVSPVEVDMEDGVEVITVWGPFALRQARADVVRKMDDIGWRKRDRLKRDGSTVFLPPSPWMGRVLLSEDGNLSFTRPVMAFEGVGSAEQEFDHEIGLENDVSTPASTVDFSLLPERAKLDAVHASVLDAVRPELTRLRSVVRETHAREILEGVAEKLDRLWQTGQALDGSDAWYDTAEARRGAALDFWTTRADNLEGNAVADATALWLINVVQASETPLTDEEIARANQRASPVRRLELQ